MDIGKFKNNYEFYKGFEDEPEIILFFPESNEFNIHIWRGYICDIFDDPIFDGNKWTGFTRDYQQEVGTYEENNTVINVSEYLNDLLKYKDKHFRLEKTHDCFILIRFFLEYAMQAGMTVMVDWS